MYGQSKLLSHPPLVMFLGDYVLSVNQCIERKAASPVKQEYVFPTVTECEKPANGPVTPSHEENAAGTVPAGIEPTAETQTEQHGTAQALMTVPALQEQFDTMKQQLTAMAEMIARLTMQSNQPPTAALAAGQMATGNSAQNAMPQTVAQVFRIYCFAIAVMMHNM